MQVAKPIEQDYRTSLYQQLIETYQDGPCWLYSLVFSEYPWLIATAIVKGSGYLLWIEVGASYRRQGYATKLVRILAQHHELTVAPGTTDGERWIEAIQHQVQGVNFEEG